VAAWLAVYAGKSRFIEDAGLAVSRDQRFSRSIRASMRRRDSENFMPRCSIYLGSWDSLAVLLLLMASRADAAHTLVLGLQADLAFDAAFVS